MLSRVYLFWLLFCTTSWVWADAFRVPRAFSLPQDHVLVEVIPGSGEDAEPDFNGWYFGILESGELHSLVFPEGTWEMRDRLATDVQFDHVFATGHPALFPQAGLRGRTRFNHETLEYEGQVQVILDQQRSVHFQHDPQLAAEVTRQLQWGTLELIETKSVHRWPDGILRDPKDGAIWVIDSEKPVHLAGTLLDQDLRELTRPEALRFYKGRVVEVLDVLEARAIQRGGFYSVQLENGARLRLPVDRIRPALLREGARRRGLNHETMVAAVNQGLDLERYPRPPYFNPCSVVLQNTVRNGD